MLADAIQSALNRFLALGHLRTVTDITFIPSENIVVVKRTKGRCGVTIDVSDAACPSEIIDTLVHHSAVY